MLYLASDHAGFDLKCHIARFLDETSIPYQDMWPYTYEELDDYPDYIIPAAQKVAEDPGRNRGIIMGWSGQWEAIAANKVPWIRAIVYYGGNEEIVELWRTHNYSNILSFGARFVTTQEAIDALKKWLTLDFKLEERHMRRIDKIHQFEQMTSSRLSHQPLPLIDVTWELNKQFDHTYIDQLLLCDIYEHKNHQKSKLGSLVYYGKQLENQAFIDEAIELTHDRIIAFIDTHHIDGICYIPTSLVRKPQLMDELRNSLNIDLPEIKLQKSFVNGVIVAQKTLDHKHERKANAEKTIEIVWVIPSASGWSSIKNLLIIDDFVRSWATIHATAKKIRDQWLAQHIYCISLVWNTDFTQKISDEV